MESKIHQFVTKMSPLLEVEREAELEESANLLQRFSLKELEKRNLAITKLFMKSISTGIYGKILLHLNRFRQDQQQQQQNKNNDNEDQQDSKMRKFSPGDIVGIFSSDGSPQMDGNDKLQGIIYKVTGKEIVIAFKEMHDFESLKQPMSLVLLANEVTYKRCKEALDSLKSYSTSNNQRLVEVLFEVQKPMSMLEYNDEIYKDLQFYNKGINESQTVAIRKCLASCDVSLIHGPPGTGKTTTVVELILQSVKLQNTKILACAPSNIAVDNIIERLSASDSKIKIVRIGHPARLLESVQKYCLDALVQSSPDYGKQTSEIIRALNKLGLQVKKAKTKSDKKDIYSEYKMLKKDLKQIEQQQINIVLQQANVICCTLTSAADKTLGRFIDQKLVSNEDGLRKLFDLVVIDECAQSIEPACWIPLKFAKKVVMAGDHKQLDATVKSNQASRKGLSKSLFERVQDFKVKVPNTMLDEQYRMNEAIMTWSSDAMYAGQLKANGGVKDRLMGDLYKANSGVIGSNDEMLSHPMLIIDTVGSLMYEGVDEQSENESKYNNGECDLVVLMIKELLDLGIQMKDIGVISPYNAQVNLIRKQLRHSFLANYTDSSTQKIEVSTVDGFQGREKEAIIISMVRSNPVGEIGFLANERRMNVAITRAKRLCVLIGDSGTVSRNPFLKGLIDYFKANGLQRSAFDYQGSNNGYEVRMNYGENSGFAKKEKEPSKLSISAQQQKLKEKDDGSLNKAQKKKLKQKQKQLQEKIANDKKNGVVEEEEKKSYKPQKKEHDPKENIERENSLKEQIDEFVKDKEQETMDFPKTLNSWERQVVHAYCESLNIQHQSKGEGAERYIAVSKTKSITEAQPQQELSKDKQGKATEKIKSQPIKAVAKKEEAKVGDEPQEQQILKNQQFQEYLQRRQKLEEEKKQQQAQASKEQSSLIDDQNEDNQAPDNIAKSKKKKKNKDKKKDNKNAKPDDNEIDDMEFLNQMISENKQCKQQNCQTSIELFYVTCKLCKQRFCAVHLYPETHQCEKIGSEDPSLNNEWGGKGLNKKVQKENASSKLRELQSQRAAKPSKKQQQETRGQNKKI